MTLAIIQARMTSTRLPGKTLARLGSDTVLSLLVGRLQRARRLDDLAIATSVDPEDDPIEEAGRALGVRVHRGPRDDVLTRFRDAADGHAGPYVRVTADCPLIDPEIVDATVELFERSQPVEYASNIEPRTYPDGLDVEVIAPAALERVAGDAVDAADREHVTTAIRRDPQRFRQVGLAADEDLGELRWTLDYADDLEFLRQVTARLGERRYDASMREILAAIRAEPSLADFAGARG